MKRSRLGSWSGSLPCSLVLALTCAAAAREGTALAMRRLFEPTDLEIEEPGLVEVDVQMGVVRGRQPWRLSVPDFEVDVGLFGGLELDLDGAFSWEGRDDGTFKLDHWDDDNLWVSLKTSLLSWDDPLAQRGLGLGVQVGPKCPTARGARGFGMEGLLLLAWHSPRVQLVLNGGGLWDPNDGGNGRPLGFEGGVDLEIPLDAAGHFSLLGEAGGVAFASADAAQFSMTAGLAWDVREDLQLSLVALAGFLEGSDRYGLLLGVSPKLALFRRKP